MVHADAVAIHYRSPDHPGYGFALVIMLFWALHQSADDMLLCRDATKKVSLGRRGGLIVEDRRMTRMGDEISDVIPLWEVSGLWSRRIENDHHCAGCKLIDNRAGNLTNQCVRNCKNYCVGISQGICCFHGIVAKNGSDPLLTRWAHLNMANCRTSLLEIRSKADAHFSARTEQCYGCHVRKSSPSFLRRSPVRSCLGHEPLRVRVEGARGGR